MNNELQQEIEILAEYAHDAWSGWMKYLFSKCENSSAGMVIPDWANERWTRQMNTNYSDLPENEKESDRDEACKIIKLLD